MPYLASVEVDQRQNFIQQADTLREMLGASRMIEQTIAIAAELATPGVVMFWPVSGVVRFFAEKSGPLGEYLTRYLTRLEELSLTASTGIEKYEGDFDEALAALELRTRHRKDSKTASVVVPTTPYFASCSILPQFPANHWNPAGHENRQLRCWQAVKREELQKTERSQRLFGFRIPCSNLPTELEHFAPPASDSYIALLKGDVDGLGRLLALLRFEKLAVQLGDLVKTVPHLPPPAAAAKLFCLALENAVKRSIHDAFEQVYPEPARKPDEFWPFRHLIAAGDDVFILSRRPHAIHLARLITEKFAAQAEQDSVIRAALESTGIGGLTISFGVLFAKLGYPFDASFDLAEELLKSAKSRGRNAPQPDPLGYVDFHWLGDSARPELHSIRTAQEFYRDDHGTPLWLSTKPWSMGQLEDHRLAAKGLSDAIPRRKLKQLEGIVRLGRELSELAFRAWWSRLREKEQGALQNSLKTLAWPVVKNQIPTPWRPDTRSVEGPPEPGFATCLVDLLDLTEIAK